MVDVEQLRKDTLEAFKNPRPGDWFHEMCGWYIFVLSVDNGIIIKDGEGVETKYNSPEEFSKAYEYKTIPGHHWVVYGGNNLNK